MSERLQMTMRVNGVVIHDFAKPTDQLLPHQAGALELLRWHDATQLEVALDSAAGPTATITYELLVDDG